MSEFSQDYDYPSNEKKPVLTIRPDKFWYKNINHHHQHQKPSSAKLSSSSASSGYVSTNLSNGRSASFNHSSNDYVVSGTSNGTPPAAATLSGTFRTLETHPQELSILDVPLPPKNGANYNSIYYDLPKNIPVNPRFVMEKSPSMSHLPSKSSHLEMRKPEIPQKSTLVREKMSTYKNTLPNYQNIKPYLEQLRRKQEVNRSTTCKALPKLPGAQVAKSTSVENGTNGTIPVPVTDTVPIVRLPEQTATSNNKQTGVLITNDDHDDDDDDDDSLDGDYDYDYVCLESKKKLDDDDQKIKRLLSKESRFRYQDLVLSSSSNGSSNGDFTPNPKSYQIMRPYYRVRIMQAQQNLQQWTEFAVEILEQRRQQQKPEVYFNFVKHILLSGQNLLSILKMSQKNRPSTNHHQQHQQHKAEEDVKRFSEQFLDLLKQIVAKMKKASASISQRSDDCDGSFAELIDCLQHTSQMARDCPKII